MRSPPSGAAEIRVTVLSAIRSSLGCDELLEPQIDVQARAVTGPVDRSEVNLPVLFAPVFAERIRRHRSSNFAVCRSTVITPVDSVLTQSSGDVRVRTRSSLPSGDDRDGSSVRGIPAERIRRPWTQPFFRVRTVRSVPSDLIETIRPPFVEEDLRLVRRGSATVLRPAAAMHQRCTAPLAAAKVRRRLASVFRKFNDRISVP